MDNILDLIGNTPMVKVDSIGSVEIFAKLEYYNPTGSVKDRAALYMIKGAIDRGDLKKDGVIIEPTSGNTGIGMAMVAKQLGYKLILTMPDSMSLERRQILTALGAELVLTSGAKGMQGAIDRANELLLEMKSAYIPMQFANPDNAKAHYEGTAPEIFREINPIAVVCGIGSGGTAMGIKAYIRDNNYTTQIIAVEPSASPMLTKGVAGGHKIQGIGANFIPKLLKVDELDKIMTVSDEDAFAGARELALNKGVMSGISGGAAFVAARKYAEEANKSGISGEIVFIVPDNSMKYLSMNIYG